MRLKEGWVLFFVFLTLMVPTLIVIVGEVTQDVSYSDIKKFELSKTSAPLRFYVIGDFGDLDSTEPINNTEPVVLVSQSMQKHALVRPVSFILSVGDNSYPHAYSNFDQVIYKLMYHVFDIEGLKAKPWYLVLGNHDCMVNCDFEINSNRIYPMWNMPSNYYNFTVNIDAGYKVGFTFLDGVILIGNNPNAIGEQYAWLHNVLNDQMNDTKVLWKVVTIHMPMWSPGQYHGDDETLKQSLYPILYKYKVDVVLAGHEHVMAHYASRIINNKPQAFIPLPNATFDCNLEEFAPYGTSSSWTQGEAMHEVLQGASGRELYETCPNKTTDMADLLFGFSTFGYSEIYIDHTVFSIDYYNLTVSKPLFSVRIKSKIS